MKNPCEQCQNYRAHYIKTENGYEKSPHGECGWKDGINVMRRANNANIFG